MTPIVSTHNLTKSFLGSTILQGITLDIMAGEFVMLTGESGSGKSTLLSLIAGLDFGDSGELLVNQMHIHESLSAKELARFRVLTSAMIYQDFHLLPVLDVWDNILLPARLHLSKQELQLASDRAAELSLAFGLSNVLHSMPHTLSGGEKQRTAIIRALLCKPLVLLADEPTGNLDSRNTEIVMDIFSSLHSEGQTILMVTHSPVLAKRGSRQLHLQDGVLTG